MQRVGVWGWPYIDLFATRANAKLPLQPTCLPFPIPWLGNRMRFNILGTNSVHTPPPPLHFAFSGLVRSPSFDRVLLVQPYIWKFHCSVGTIHLHMWKLSNVSSERLAFRERLLRSLLRISGALKQYSTRGSGLESSISVVDGISLHARPLFGR